MYCKFQIYQGGEWVNFGRLTYPLTLGDTLTADTSSAFSVTLYMKGETELALESLTPGTLCRINFYTRIYWFVIVDGGRVSPRAGLDFCFHSYSIQEMLCYAREIYVQSAFFSNGLYDVPSFFTRLFALSESDLEQVLYTSDGYGTLVANWQKSDYQVASNSLLDNLIKIGQNNQVRFKARVNDDGELEYYAESLKGDAVLASINGRKIGETKQYLGANFASRVVANVENISSSQFFWFPEDDKLTGVNAEPDNEARSVASSDSLVLNLPYKIKSCDKVRVYGLGRVIEYDTDFEWEYKDFFGNLIVVETPDRYAHFLDYGWPSSTDYYRNIVGVPVEIECVEYREWLMLAPDGLGSAAQHQQNTLYFKRGENKIYNIQICSGVADGLGGRFSSNPLYYKRPAGTSDDWGAPEYQNLIPHLNSYVPHCDFYMDGVLVSKNKNSSHRTAHYSQEDNIVSGKSLIANMQTYIDSMQNTEEILTYEFDSIDDVPTVGKIYNGKVISSINFECTNKKITATMTLSDELVKKSEFLSADSGLTLSPIQTDKAYNRMTNYSQTLWFCETSTHADTIIAERSSNAWFSDAFVIWALDSLKNGRKIQAKIPAEILMKTGNYEGYEVSTAIDLSVKTVSRSLLIAWKTKDNAIVGTKMETVTYPVTNISNFIFFPVGFLAPEVEGKSKRIQYKILSDSVRNSESMYPAIDNTNFDNYTALVSIDDANHYHDPAEVINGLMQINFLGYESSVIVYPAFINECSLVNDTKYQEDPYARHFQANGIFGNIITSSVSKISDTKFRVSARFENGNFTVGQRYDVLFYRSDGVNDDFLLNINCEVIQGPGDAKDFIFWIAITK
jgi:hypothetical protein